MTYLTYRVTPEAATWFVQTPVKGPLGRLWVNALIAARDEAGAIDQHERRLLDAGFELLGNTKAWRT